MFGFLSITLDLYLRVTASDHIALPTHSFLLFYLQDYTFLSISVFFAISLMLLSAER